MTLNNSIRWIAAFVAAVLFMFLFRATVLTLCVVEGPALAPVLLPGDRVVVNRWSYGLRTGGGDGLFGYGRVLRQPVERGDIVAFDSSSDSIPGVFFCRCMGVPGDTVRMGDDLLVVPGIQATCADADYYWMESLAGSVQSGGRTFGFVSERQIIGRVWLVVYNHDDGSPFYKGYDTSRVLLPLD